MVNWRLAYYGRRENNCIQAYLASSSIKTWPPHYITKGEFPCRPPDQHIIYNSGSEVFACSKAQAAIQPQFGGPLGCAGLCTHAPRLPCAQLTYNCQLSKDLDRLKSQENQCWYGKISVVTRRRKLVGGPGFGRMEVATLNMTFSSYAILCHYGNFLDDTSYKWVRKHCHECWWVHRLAKTMPSLVSDLWWIIVMDDWNMDGKSLGRWQYS